MRVTISSKGDFKRTANFLTKMSKGDLFRNLDGLAQKGVAALAAATPFDSGNTAGKWSYEVKVGMRSSTITWKNSNLENGFPVAVMLQYGHGTGSGGYVQGRDYINPTLKPIFDRIADQAWKAVISA
jgi:hypothetical protein